MGIALTPQSICHLSPDRTLPSKLNSSGSYQSVSRLVRCAVIPDLTIAQAFEHWATLTPEAFAVVCGETGVTYGELNARANQLAHFLIRRGVKAETAVGICAERSIEMVVGQLGVLKAGGVYVPLDADYPAERLAFMLEDTNPPVLLTQRHLQSSMPSSPSRLLVCLDEVGAAWESESKENPVTPITADSLAYIIYTSGSTGQSKGVALAHRGVVRLVHGQDYAPFEPGQRFLMLASPSFDGIIFELWGPLLNGACCVVFAERWPEASRLEHVIQMQRVSCMFLTTGLFNQILDHRPEALTTLGTLLVGGEAHSVRHTQRALALLPDTILVNGYGPTECTTFACTYRIGPSETWGSTSVPIGGPINNTECVIVDEAMGVVEVGEPGELLLGGPGLAREYWRHPELTAQKFVPHPLPEFAGNRLYRTGDRCRLMANGEIEYLGRIDDQIKLHGYRIEPGEIECALREHTFVSDAVVFIREHENGRQLAAAIVPEVGGRSPPAEELRAWLRVRLPDYMIPVWWTYEQVLPLTSNGKVDRRKLVDRANFAGRDDGAVSSKNATLEQELLAIWRRLLGDQTVGLNDDFFQLGGDSMSSMELALEVGRLFQRPIPVGWVYQAPTAAAMARLVAFGDEHSGTHQGEAPLCLFHLPGLHGGIKAQVELGKALSSRWRSIYTLVYPGSLEKRGQLERIEDFAGDIVRQIRAIQSKGPYALCGFSFGAARQLELTGGRVEKLVLWDPGLVREIKTESRRKILRQFWGKVSRKVCGVFRPKGWRTLFTLSPLTREQLRRPWLWILPRQRAISMLSRQPDWSGDFVVTALRAFANYRLPKYHGDVVLMQAWREDGKFAPTERWEAAIKGKLKFHHFECPHDEMLRGPLKGMVIETTRRELESVG